MGRIFETRKTAMFARWNKMAKVFTRVSKDITIAVKAGGVDPATNSSLRRAIQNGRAANMPKDKLDAAIKRAQGKDTANYDVVLYEGYAPHGIAVMVETATDNVTRTVANVRLAFKDWGGNMGATGSVKFLFQHLGVFKLSPTGVDVDALELDLIDHGLQELGEGVNEKGEKELIARCAFEDFGKLQHGIEAKGLVPLSSGLEYVPLSFTTLPEDQATEVLKMVDALEQDEDVQHVFHNLG
jgi:YebC/PmpR family DNA-binding regulatory protein